MTSSAKCKNCRRQKFCQKFPLLCLSFPLKHWQREAVTTKASEEKLNPWSKKKCFPSLPWLHRLVYMHTDSNGKDEASFSKQKPEINYNIFYRWKIISNVTDNGIIHSEVLSLLQKLFFKDQIEKWANIGYSIDYICSDKSSLTAICFIEPAM